MCRWNKREKALYRSVTSYLFILHRQYVYVEKSIYHSALLYLVGGAASCYYYTTLLLPVSCSVLLLHLGLGQARSQRSRKVECRSIYL